MKFQRTELLIGKDGLQSLSKSKVAIVGLGGVGGYVAMMLVRSGIENFILVDFDTIDETNINRQIIASEKTIGLNKVDVCKSMMLDINSNCNITTYCEKISKDNVSKILNDVDICVDAIDMVTNKIELIEYCKLNDIEIISACGAGNRCDIPNFYVTDIYKTAGDGLAKIMRKKLKEKNINSLKVVISSSLPIKTNSKEIGSISYYPAVCGCVVSSYVVNYLINKN